jgi:hypothetical protein
VSAIDERSRAIDELDACDRVAPDARLLASSHGAAASSVVDLERVASLTLRKY